MKLYATSFQAGQKRNIKIIQRPVIQISYSLILAEQKRANQESARKKVDLFVD